MDAVAWHDVWERVADDLGGWGARGMGHLLTEDVLRFATIRHLIELGQLLPQSFRDDLRRFEVRHEHLRLPEAEGAETVLDPVLLTSLPRSVSVLMDRWAEQDLTVRARCVESRPVGDELLLLVHAVEPIAPAG